ncbi:TonB-dependent receptor [Xanthomarina spongicola]|uniref:Iron complex outermembrane receptor protein n=1 Tax=Xanthomarina spongicola TaxID=570520 RepID=A0A316DPC0_9FLAO|nr:TonB-dependent receptor [Xanthomarina spongicola]PWK19805.1 iron complex outermembrane receptor protein [Xanthomarina spongicola]
MKQITTLFLLCFASSIFAQHSIEGTLLENNTNTPIAFANIYLPQIEKGATTDESGYFFLNNLPTGSYKIVCSFIGYESYSKTISIPLTESLEIFLNSSAIEMEEIIISTPFHKLQSENVMKVEQEKITDLKAKGAITLSDGITNIAGVESISTGMSIGKPVIRGLSSNRVLVYTQGVRLENQQYGSEHGLGLSDSGIESIEVIKGPASLLYGSDALGGVLYINPEKFAQQNTQTGDLNATYFSNTLGYNTNLGYKSSGENLKFLFRGSLSEHSDYDTADYRVTNTRFKEQDFKAGIGYQDSKIKTEFRYNVNNSKLGIPEEIGEQTKSKSPELPYQEITNHVFSSKSNVFFDNSSLEINLGYIYNNRKEFEEHHDGHEEHSEEEEEEEEHDDEALEAALQMKLKTFNYDIKYQLPVYGKFETIVGTQGMNQINTNYGEEQLIPDATTNDFGLFAMSHIHFDKADVQLGLRFDNRVIDVVDSFNKNFNSFNGALGVKTKIANTITARVNFATGFRAPNLAELTSYGTHEGTNRFEIGNENLTSEQNFQTDLSLEFKNEHIEFFANGFYNIVNNYIFLLPEGTFIDNEPVYNYVQDNAKLYGGEIGFHLHPHPIDWLHFESSFESVTGKQDNGEYLPLIPANSLTNTIRIENDGEKIQKQYAFIALRSTFNQNNVSQFETTTSGYNLLSAGFGGVVSLFKKDLSITVSGSNLTNKKYINHLSRLKPEGIYNMGRNISVGITYTL